MIRIKKATKFKILLALFSLLLATVVGFIASNFFIFSIDKRLQDIFDIKEGFNGILTSKPHLLLFLAVTAFAFVGCIYVFFWRREATQSRVDMVQLTPDIEIPTASGSKQYGSSRFTNEAEQDADYTKVVISPGDNLIKRLIDEGELDIQAINNGEVRAIEVLQNDLSPKQYPSGIPIACTTSSSSDIVRLISGDLHCICFGTTRCGKTRTLVIQSICLQALARSDLLCTDPKGELYIYTYPMLKRLGYNAYALDFKNPERSIHYNFLQVIIDAINGGFISKAIQCCWDFVDCIVPQPTGNAEPLWSNGEKAIMAAAVMMVVYDNSPMGLPQQYPNATAEEIAKLYDKHKKYQNCTNLFNFISNLSRVNPETEQLVLEDIIAVLPENHPSKLIMAIAQSAPSKMRGSFITSALTTLRLFTDPNIASMTSYTDDGIFDYDKKKAIFLITPDSKKTYYPLVSLFVAQYYQLLAEVADDQGGRLARNFEFNLDEFGLMKLPEMDLKISVAAGRGIHFYLYLQSYAQLTEKYGKDVATILLDNCHYTIYLKTSIETAELFEKRMGKYTVKAVSSSASVNDNGGLSTVINSSSTSSSTQLMARSLLTADEITHIKRPYVLTLSDYGYPSLTQSPDLHLWQFNKMLGLGDVAFNTSVRNLREKARTAHKAGELELWDFLPYINRIIKKNSSEQLDDSWLQDEVARNFANNF